jgi:hypothetical protein
MTGMPMSWCGKAWFYRISADSEGSVVAAGADTAATVYMAISSEMSDCRTRPPDCAFADIRDVAAHLDFLRNSN